MTIGSDRDPSMLAHHVLRVAELDSPHDADAVVIRIHNATLVVVISAETRPRSLRVNHAFAPRLAEFAARHALSASEIRVLREAQSLAATKEIAERMGITVATVQTYLQRIFHKTGIRSLRQILRTLIRE